MKEFKTDLLQVKILDSRQAMGRAAAADIRDAIAALLEQQSQVNMIFAAAPSQNEALAQLIALPGIDWSRINAFHMDEYIGLPQAYQDRSFGTYLREHIFDAVPFASVHLIDSAALDHEGECARYGQLLREYPTDIVVMGIGENGHIAFNDPWVADFQDPLPVKQVALDPVCRMQQVNDGCFPCLEAVPEHAITLTCPTLFAGRQLFCIVPAKTKAAAVKRTLEGPISEDCPATILRQHPCATLYLDPDSSKELTL